MLFRSGRLQFFGDHVGLADRAAFNAYIAPLRDIDWVVYAKKLRSDNYLGRSATIILAGRVARQRRL